jgi:ethylbenzene dioxygenase ferredoxin subunit
LRTYKVIVTDREVFADVALEADEALAAANSPV